MSVERELNEIIRAFLASVRFTPPGTRWSFIAESKSNPYGGFCREFYIDTDRCRLACLRLLRSPLGKLLEGRVEQAKTLLQEFLKVEVVQDGEFPFARLGTVLDYLTEETVLNLAQRFPGFLEEQSQECFYLLPMRRLVCPEEIDQPTCVWWPADRNLDALADRFGAFRNELLPGQFPPIRDDPRMTPLSSQDSWLGCYARQDLFGMASLRRIAGALLLGLDPDQSLFISGAEQPSGLFIIRPGRFGFHSRPSPLPLHPQQVEVDPSASTFVRTVTHAAVTDSRLAIALECCGSSWRQSERDRFMQLSVAFDALFGVPGKVGKSIRAGIKTHAGEFEHAEERARLLLNMRNDLLHGDAFALTQCEDYLIYHERYSVSPARDQLNLLRACVRSLSSP
ncbi:hypothetical protein [Pseudomonas sp. JG-B]|uniref:hypothetical protein n=1 Tax=Pseudomonas sp. JG-B TaxID=2603214 RepID=UPI00129EAA10|nr:hypothetical protein [Pseudomonas sp. JG-B]MRK21952.1 hypothetical protein [Pseudomonas sp. JG-B]